MRLFTALVLGLALVGAACDPVMPVEAPDTWTYEGFTVHSHIPDDPVGIVYLFHGSGGSAAFASKIETVDQTNILVERGYGWVATESTDRTGDRRWEVHDPSLITNPDLARLNRLHDHLEATTSVEPATPILGVGMSNGARMVTLFGQSFLDAGRPVAAVAPFMGQLAKPVRAAGGLTVPAFWVIAENDPMAPAEAIVADQQQQEAAGVPTALRTKPEEPLLAARFTRIPEIDSDEAEAIRAALEGTGVWDTNGTRVLPLEEAWPLIEQLRVPPSFGVPSAVVGDQVQALLALHQFVGFHRVGVADFFDAQIG